MEKIKIALTSGHTYVVLATWFVLNYSNVAKLLPTAWGPILSAIVGILVITFHINPIQQLGAKVRALGGSVK